MLYLLKVHINFPYYMWQLKVMGGEEEVESGYSNGTKTYTQYDFDVPDLLS